MATAVAVATMKVAQIPKGGAEFQIVEREVPEPGPGQVRIKVQACGVCHSDSLTVEGSWPGIQYPRAPGHEVAGIIDSAPAQVDESSTRRPLNIGPTHVCTVHCTVESPHRRGGVPRMQIQQFFSAVFALHANMDIGIARKVAAGSTFAAR